MIIKEGTKLTITHLRKGTFKAIAVKDFNTEDTFWEVILAEGEVVAGNSIVWLEGEEIPCRKNLVHKYEVTGSINEPIS